VVKAYPQRTPLQLTLGVNDNSVEKGTPSRKLTISLELQQDNHFPKVVSRLTEEGALDRGRKEEILALLIGLCWCKTFRTKLSYQSALVMQQLGKFEPQVLQIECLLLPVPKVRLGC